MHPYAIGVDLGGTKIDVARINQAGAVEERVRLTTDVKGGPKAIEQQIITAVQQMRHTASAHLVGVGVGVAGQIDAASGLVHFAPNLNWHHVPLQDDLIRALQVPIFIINDVRAATCGEWYYGAGKGSQDLVCLFVGTGIGGGVISGGHLLRGCSNTLGELGHMTVSLNGPPCTCGNWGCMEALAGGWAIARRAQELVDLEPVKAQSLLYFAQDKKEAITAKVVIQAYREKDPLAQLIIQEAEEALIAGTVGLVNAFNPCRLIFGGGLIEGMPEIIQKIEKGIRQRALKAATASLEVLPTQLHQDAGVIGAATVAMHQEAIYST